MSKQYEIKTIEDFFKIPDNRIDDCLDEFKEFISIVKPVVSLANTISDATKTQRAEIIKFTWIDDGKRNKKIIINNIIQKTDKEPVKRNGE